MAIRFKTINEEMWFGAQGWSFSRLIYWEGHELRFNFYCGIENYSDPSATVVRASDGALYHALTEPKITPLYQQNKPHSDYFGADFAALCVVIQNQFANEVRHDRPLNLYDCVTDPNARGSDLPLGIALVLQERQRQVGQGWDANHDDEHDDGSLALIAACFAAPVQLLKREDEGGEPVFFLRTRGLMIGIKK